MVRSERRSGRAREGRQAETNEGKAPCRGGRRSQFWSTLARQHRQYRCPTASRPLAGRPRSPSHTRWLLSSCTMEVMRWTCHRLFLRPRQACLHNAKSQELFLYPPSRSSTTALMRLSWICLRQRARAWSLRGISVRTFTRSGSEHVEQALILTSSIRHGMTGSCVSVPCRICASTLAQLHESRLDSVHVPSLRSKRVNAQRQARSRV